MPYNPQKQGSKMFVWATHTINFMTGCHHECSYNCWAREWMIRTSREFEAHRKIEKNFVRFNGKDARIATNLLGDAFCSCETVPEEWIMEMFGVIRSSDPSNTWLLQTKNPRGYYKYLERLPPNVLLGVTIESDVDHMKTRAPTPEQRFLYTLNIPPGFRRFLSIEPIMRFTPLFPSWIRQLNPEVVEIGLDTCDSGLKEPTMIEVKALISVIEKMGIKVNVKPSLQERLTK